MSSFDDAVNRHLSESRLAQQQQEARELSRQAAADRAAWAMVRLLQELAYYLAQRVQPRSVVLIEKRKRDWIGGTKGWPEYRSPEGFVLVPVSPTSGGLTLLASDGRIWKWTDDRFSRINYRDGDYIDVRGRFRSGGPVYVMGYSFSAGENGMLTATIRDHVAETTTTMEPNEAMARIAARVLEGSA